MNGPHDMGGMQCYGPVVTERDEPVFHHDWERRALAVTVAMGATGTWTLDAIRHARETLPPAQYLAASYYEIWIAALARLLAERGMVTSAELERGTPDPSVKRVPLARVPDRDAMIGILAAGNPVERDAPRPAAFRAGQAVRTRNINPAGHTRLPRYARDKPGIVECVIGCHVFPDSNAHDGGEDPQWLYTVRFEARALFGGEADHWLHVDCWEPYLDAAG